ncbi:fibronectin type III domain-containing protein [Streptomyces scopuliridis]|uniref:fibronectin type III domain-containing protein n=1 Tax=Streptomyces scopuliridis TaxID=452529 RepID=UPI0034320364
MTAAVTRWPADGDRVRFRLADPLGHPEFAWPRTLLRYPVRWAVPSVRAEWLRLIDGTGEPVPFQLSRVSEEDGHLTSAVVCFFGELASGAAHEYCLRADASLRAADVPRPVRITEDSGTVVVDNGALGVRLPSSGRFTDGAVPGPVLQLNRGQGWMGTSALRCGDERLEHLETHLVEAGPLFATHEIRYRFASGAGYTASVRCLQGCDFFELSEEMTSLDSATTRWELSWDGVTPSHRNSSTWPLSQSPADHADPGSPAGYHWLGIDEPIVLGDSGEDPSFSGPGGKERPDTDFAFTVGPYAPSYAWNVRPHATFWDVARGDAMGVFVRDHAQWDDRTYASWASADILQLRFRYDGVLRWTWPLRSGTRQTSIAFYHHQRDLDVLRDQSLTTYPSTYVRSLHHWQGTLSLDRVKDWKLTYSGRRPAQLCREGEFGTPEEFAEALLTGSDGPRLIAHGVNELPGYLNIGQRPLYDRLLDGYDRFAGRLAASDRQRVDALLLLTAYVSEGEEIGPIRRMLGGHPNFLADGKAALACLAWLFPDHEAAPRWLDRFEKFVELTGVLHTRPELPAHRSRAGRWTESLATYVWAFLRPVTQGNHLGQLADGRNRLATPEFAAVGDWLVNALTAPVEISATGETRRLHPAQGAHAFWPRRPPVEMRLLGEALRRYRPLVAEHLLWGSDASAHRLDSPHGAPDPWRVMVRSTGNQGTNPRLKSSKYTGYGITLRSHVDQPDEIAVFLQQVDRGPNYRWGIADDNGCGHLYYYAGGRSYSGHGPEDAGDRRAPDATFVSSCAIWTDGAYHAIGQNTLDRPFYDLGCAQYAEITSDPDGPAGGRYLSRSVLLVGGDYLVTYDSFAANQRMVWTWSALTEPTGHDANSFHHLAERLPFIHVVRGVRTDGALDGAFTTEVSHGVRLEGRADGGTGNTLAVVSHRDDLTIDPERVTPWGARIRTPHSLDYVFRHEAATHYQPKTIEFAENGLRFSGTAGTIRLLDDGSRQLTLFHGSAVGTSDLLLTTDDEDLGISLCYRDSAESQGTYDAPSDSSVSLRILDGLDGLGTAVGFYIDGERARPLSVSRDAITVALPRGRHRWELTGRRPEPTPSQVVRTETTGDGALVHFTMVAAARCYLVQLSSDGGTTWTPVAEVEQSPCRLTGLADGEKYHVRVVARNSARQAAPGADYPVYAERRAPDPPDGLTLRLSPGSVTATWGEVLGAGRYRLYRRRKGDRAYREVFAGLGFRHIDDAPGVVPGYDDPDQDTADVTVYEYAVAAENGNGVGPKSAAVDTDPRSPRHWYPPTDLVFRRQHTYNQPPYVPASASPRPYPDQVPPPALPAIAHPAGETS